MLQRRIAKIGLSKQSAKGSAASTATLAAGVTEGGVLKIDVAENDLASTWSNRTVQGHDRVSVKPDMDFGLIATPSLTGLLIMAALGNDVVTGSTSTTLSASSIAGATTVSSVVTIPGTTVIQIDTGANAEIRTVSSVSGAGPFTLTLNSPLTLAHSSGATVQTLVTHTITTANDVPYLTGFGTLDTTQWSKIVDGKINTLELSWDMAGALKAKVGYVGMTPSFLAAAYTETNQELIAQVGYLDAAGGTFNVEGATAQVTGGTVKIDNHIDQVVLSAAVTPNEVFPGQRDITYSLKIVPNDMALFREVVYNSPAAGALSAVATSPYYGAVDLKWLAGLQSAEITSPRCRFAVAFPDANPAGGPAEVTLEAVVTMPNTGSDTTSIVQNFVSAY